jgi:cell division protein FtsA
MALRTPTKSAEGIKLTHGCAIPEYVNPSQTIDVMSVNERTGRKIATTMLCDVILARYEELFSLVRNELRRSGFEDLLAAGIVLTGGASKVRGAIELAESCFELPVRLGAVQQIAGLSEVVDNPSLSTCVGLLMHGVKQQNDNHIGVSSLNEGAINIWNKMKQWFTVNF